MAGQSRARLSGLGLFWPRFETLVEFGWVKGDMNKESESWRRCSRPREIARVAGRPADSRHCRWVGMEGDRNRGESLTAIKGFDVRDEIIGWFD